MAVDAMGGDRAPDEIVSGAIDASGEWGIEVLLVGDEERLRPMVESRRQDSGKVEIVHAASVIPMGAPPIDSVRRYKDSSIVIAAGLVGRGEAAAMVSAGDTGAAMAASVLHIGRLQGVERPAIGTVLPTVEGPCLLLDAGANVDSRPQHLVQFAVMGARYAERVLGIQRPRVGLLNIGEEESKGNEVAVEAHERLKETQSIHFIGNVEGRDIPTGKVDVVVCDGFVGNIVLKFAEGFGTAMFDLLKKEATREWRSRLGALFLRSSLRRIKRRFDYAEYGGAPLLGLRGITIISHGRSNAKAIKNAVRVAADAAGGNVTAAILETLGKAGDGNA